MARTQEKLFNAVLGDILRNRHPRWEIQAESTRVLSEGAGLQPDLVIDHFDGLPVIVETEFMPARGVEDDAKARLGLTLDDDGREIEQVIALRVPDPLSTGKQGTLRETIEAEQGLEFCLFSIGPAGSEGAPAGARKPPVRWPQTGWIAGNVDDLADWIELASLSENRVAEGLSVLEEGISQAANRVIKRASDQLQEIAEKLHQEPGEQTTLMAMAIIANAFTFHLAILSAHPKIKSPASLWRGNAGLRQAKILDHWEFIYNNINYWPIFKIASDVLEPIPAKVADEILGRLFEVASRLDALGATSQHDLCGRMFQRLISDRKFLATFYTLPSSAALLAELAVSRLDTDWADGEAVCGLRIADFACGTGALLNAVYAAVGGRHRRAGGDDKQIHARMMQDALVGTDIMPSATHLTATVLSSVHPGIAFDKTSVVTLPYGKQPEGTGRSTIMIGALDLIDEETTRPLFGTGRKEIRGTSDGGEGGEGNAIDRVDLPHGGFDLVIMNPPFTRSTGQEAKKIGIPIPAFAGFSTTDAEQRAMSRRLQKIRKPGMVGRGNAGLASDFIDLANVKVRDGGVLALVLPATFPSGEAWAPAWQLLINHYCNINIVGIATAGATDRAFSADTGMAEVLVIATKKHTDKQKLQSDGSAPTRFINLLHRPRTILEAVATARAINRLEGGRQSGSIFIGAKERIGYYIDGAVEDTGGAGVVEVEVVQTAAGLEKARLHLPRGYKECKLSLVNLDALGQRGLYHQDISGPEISRDGFPRGPFDITNIQPKTVPTWPALWSHDAKRETRLIVAPDSQGEVRPGCDTRADTAWSKTASRLHFNRDFRLNSQPLAACMTPEPSIGGRAWPSFLCAEPRWQVPLVLWANTTLGLIAFWWIGTRQQNGRVALTVLKLPALTVLDPRELTDAQFDRADAIFEAFKGRDLLPANEAWRDNARKGLDRAVLIDLLNLPEDILDPLDLLRRQWCAEPSVHGGKNTAPATS